MNELTQIGTVGFCNLLGVLIKAVPEIPNRFIPHILAGVGAVCESFRVGLSFDSVTNGAIMGAASVGLHQLFSALKQPASAAPPSNPPTS